MSDQANSSEIQPICSSESPVIEHKDAVDQQAIDSIIGTLDVDEVTRAIPEGSQAAVTDELDKTNISTVYHDAFLQLSKFGQWKAKDIGEGALVWPRHLGQYEEAEALLLATLTRMEENLDRADTMTTTCMASLASTYKSQGRYDVAEELLNIAVRSRSKALGAKYPETLDSLANLAAVRSNQGRWSLAEQMACSNVPIMKEVLGVEHATTLSMQNTWATVLAKQGLGRSPRNMNGRIFRLVTTFGQRISRERNFNEAEHRLL